MPQHKWGKPLLLPRNPCEGCGKIIEPRQHIDKRGRKKGWYIPLRFCSTKCANITHLPERHKWAKGKYIDQHGYVILARGKKTGYRVPEHRFVMEQLLGRELRPDETVHHKNGIRHDNRPENLELWSGNHGKGQRSHEQDIWSGMIPHYQIDCAV